jgi:hypothetical protein
MSAVTLAFALLACGPATFTIAVPGGDAELPAPPDDVVDPDDTGTVPDETTTYAGDTLMVYEAGEWDEDECSGTFTLTVDADGDADGYATCTAGTWTAEGALEGTVVDGAMHGEWTYDVGGYDFVADMNGTVTLDAVALHVIIEGDDWTSEGDWTGEPTGS